MGSIAIEILPIKALGILPIRIPEISIVILDCQLGSGAIKSCQLRSGRAHCDRELAWREEEGEANTSQKI